MAGDDSKTGSEKPSEQRGGTVPGEQEAREKGPWGGTAGDGIVPAELGGSDAPRETLGDEDPGYSDAALGRTTGSNEPATDGGIDPAAGDAADATTQGGADLPGAGEVDTKDVAQAAIKRGADDDG
jgi:hypothetical protein